MLFHKTEGWILAIRMELLAKSYPYVEGKKGGAEINENNLDRLMDQISQNIDPTFFRQMQLIALCHQFNVELIDSVCNFAAHDSCKADVFISKLKELNFFLIPTADEGVWYRFHHLFGDILKRQLNRTEPEIIAPLYVHISSWYAKKGLIDEAIEYAIKAQNFELACNLISEHRTGFLEQGQWWVVQRWLNTIPRQFRKDNVDLLNSNVFIIDTIGILTKIYSYADIAYVGGGFGNPGVHNILEPATFGVPIVIGPNYAKFNEAIELVQNAACFVTDSSQKLSVLLSSFFIFLDMLLLK